MIGYVDGVVSAVAENMITIMEEDSGVKVNIPNLGGVGGMCNNNANYTGGRGDHLVKDELLYDHGNF